ncbi:MAG TPA: DUF692 domain-containing protein [Thermoanaerobaculia bacterium]
MRLGFPDLGFGLGLRRQHYQAILEEAPAVDWFEIISENFMTDRGWGRHVLERVASRYPIVMHGVSLSIGSSDPLDFEYLARLRALAHDVRAVWISDHLCWTGVAGRNSHDLLPLPLNEESLAHVVARVRVVQDFLGRRILLENPSSYLTFTSDTMPEWEFLARMADAADCGLLLDVNNVYVSSVNHGFDPVEYLESVPSERVVQIHLAGHTDYGTHIIDTHEGHVAERVWELYRLAYARTEGVATMIEWDSEVPQFEVLLAELRKAKERAGTPACTSHVA